MARPRKRPPVPAQKPPKAIAHRAEYTRRLVTLHKAFSEHVIDYARGVLGARLDAYDPDEPRDEKGRWSANGGAPGKSAGGRTVRTFYRIQEEGHALSQSHKSSTWSESNSDEQIMHAATSAVYRFKDLPNAQHAPIAIGKKKEIVHFEGYEIGKGFDGEPLVVPTRELRRWREKKENTRNYAATVSGLRAAYDRVETRAVADSHGEQAVRTDAKKEIPHEAIFGTAEHNPKRVKIGRIQEIGGLNRANFLKDPGSYRESSFASVRAAPRESLPPVEVEVLADGGVILRDGRHRLAVAIERGEETIRAHVIQRDAQYNAVASYVGDVPTGAIKTTFTDVPKHAGGTIEAELSDMFGPLIESLGLGKFLTRMGHAITKQQANYLKRVANVPVSGVAPAGKLEAWRQQNLSLIRSLGADQIQAVGDILRPAQSMGLRWGDVADQIQATLGVGEKRARLIARDQTNKWNGAMQQQTQGDAGITSYRWTTANDQAVRGRPGGVYAKSKENHWALQGTIQRWDTPPRIPGTDKYGHPGSQIQCRCQAVPVVPWLDES